MAWQPGTYPAAPSRMHSSGLAVNTNNRNDVIAFWHAVYQASEGYETRIKWTGNYTGKNGTTDAAFVADVERRINYFRTMCGVSANTRTNTDSTVHLESTDAYKPAASKLKSEATQAAALMVIRNYNPTTGNDPAFNHDPRPPLTGWSKAAWNACNHGNLAFGIYGPDAITEYMREELSTGTATSAWNSLVGHRRWIVLPTSTDFATGDQPGSTALLPPTNVLYVLQKPNEIVADPSPGFVAYPSPGFFPAPINSRYWSLSRTGADFGSATVRMTDAAGKPVAVSDIKKDTGYGDPAIIWETSGAAASHSVYGNATFHVKVTGIGGTGIPSSFGYSVTLIHPDRLLSNQAISGSANPVSTKTTPYTFTPPTGAESLQVTTFLKQSTLWTETAESSPSPLVIDHTADNYPLLCETASFPGFGPVSGFRAFRLTFPTSYDAVLRRIPEQSFEIDRQILAKPKAKLRFLYRRGFMTKTSILATEISTDGGIAWKSAGTPITGVSNTTFDSKPSSASFNLPQSPNPIRIRFRYFTEPGTPIYTQDDYPTDPTGIFIDDITTENCHWLQPVKTTTVGKSSTRFDFNASSAGASLVEGRQWCLALRTQLGGRWFPYGPLKTVTITAP